MNILIARIDIDKNLNSEKNFNVKAYPMILLINKSEKIKYEGEANLNQLIEFIQNELEETRDLTINDLNNLLIYVILLFIKPINYDRKTCSNFFLNFTITIYLRIYFFILFNG